MWNQLVHYRICRLLPRLGQIAEHEVAIKVLFFIATIEIIIFVSASRRYTSCETRQWIRKRQTRKFKHIYRRPGTKKRWYAPSADIYEAVRPQYSRDIIAYAVEHARLTAASHLLEIGCGPGTATTALASHGICITCLEPNQIFFRIARHNCRTFPNVMFTILH